MADAENAQHAKFPALQISHLLILTLCVAFSFALIAPDLRDRIARYGNTESNPTWLMAVPAVASCFASGITLLGLIVLARQRLRGYPAIQSPGHLLVIALGPLLNLRLVMGSLRHLWVNQSWNGIRFHFLIVQILFAVVYFLPMLLVLRRLRAAERHWDVCLGCLLVWLLSGVVWCLHDLLGAHSAEILVAWATTYFAVAATGITALLIDAAKGLRRDWLHHAGIIALLAFAVSNVIHYGLLVTKWWTSWIFYWIA